MTSDPDVRLLTALNAIAMRTLFIVPSERAAVRKHCTAYMLANMLAQRKKRTAIAEISARASPVEPH